MKVHVVAEKCQGHGRCWAVAPELFEPDDLGNAQEVDGGVVPPGREREAQLAVDNCPEYAIVLATDE